MKPHSISQEPKPNIPLLYTGDPLLRTTPCVCVGGVSYLTALFNKQIICAIIDAFDSDNLRVLDRTRSEYFGNLFEQITATNPRVQIDRWWDDSDRDIIYSENSLADHYSLIVCEDITIDSMFMASAVSRGCLVLSMNDLVYNDEADMWVSTRGELLSSFFKSDCVPEDITFSFFKHSHMLNDKTLFIPNPGYFRPQGRGLSRLVFG